MGVNAGASGHGTLIVAPSPFAGGDLDGEEIA
jgi:hypothetical protein